MTGAAGPFSIQATLQLAHESQSRTALLAEVSTDFCQNENLGRECPQQGQKWRHLHGIWLHCWSGQGRGRGAVKDTAFSKTIEESGPLRCKLPRKA